MKKVQSERVREKCNVVIAAAFPPPVHGLAKISLSVATDLAHLAYVHRYDLSAGSLSRSAVYHLRRSLSVAKAAFGIVCNGFRRRPRLYIPADGGFGLVYTLFLITLGRLSRHRIFVHHHSFSAIDRPHHLMSKVVQVAGTQAVHVFLCGAMHRRFRCNYPGNWSGAVSSNAAHLPVMPALGPRDTENIQIGLLSNLTPEKGLYLFLDLVRACVDSGLSIVGVLAGPIPDAADAAAVDRACSELGDRLVYRGPLYDGEKDRFLQQLDVFVFPTNYQNEAQPNAVFEAMSAGAALIVIARACLAEDLNSDCGLLVNPSDDFVPLACAQLARWNSDRASLTSAKQASHARFVDLRAAADECYGTLLSMIAEA